MISKLFSWLPFAVAIVLFVIPFTWFTAGQIDWGGDSTRLYYLNPYSYLIHHTLFGISPSETGGPIQGFYSIPFISILVILRLFLEPTVLVELSHAVKLSAAFIFTYLSIYSLLSTEKVKYIVKRKVVSITGGLLYVFSPILTLGWDKAIFTHDQIFLNPLMFYLFLKFLGTGKSVYLLCMLFVSFAFSHNFSAGAAPAIFSFYPLTFTFLIIYSKFILKRVIHWKKIVVAAVLFLGLHSFHIVPLASKFLEPGSDIYTNVFTDAGKLDRGLGYFLGIVNNIKLSNSIFSLPQLSDPSKVIFLYSSVLPFVLFCSFLLKKNRLLLLSTIFFLISLFFVTANITRLGVEFYKALFELPGFSMFRNFFGQWNNVFIFLYSVVFAVALMQLLKVIKSSIKYIIPAYVILMLVITSLPFIKGERINNELWQSKGINILSIPSDDFVHSIDFVKNIKTDSKILTLPLSDPGYQIIQGKNGGAYQGPSTIAYLAGKKDFPGLGSFYTYRSLLKEAIQSGDIKLFKQILANFNIGYIYYNSDPVIYEGAFPEFPYQEANDFLPSTQEGYKKLIDQLNVKKIAQFGKHYHIYKLNEEDYLPHLFAATDVISSNDTSKSFEIFSESNIRKVYIQNNSGKNIGHRQDIFEARPFNPFSALINNYHLHNHIPFISHKMDQPFYPAVLLKEKYDLSSIKGLRQYVDMALLLQSKRIQEIKLSKNEMDVFSSKSLLPIGDYFLSWERSLERYKKGYVDLHRYLKNSKYEETEINPEMVKIDEQLNRQQAELVGEVNSLNTDEDSKQELIGMLNATYDSLYDLYAFPVYSTGVNSYSITLPNIISGSYELHIENIPQFEENNQTAIFHINEKDYIFPTSQKDAEYIRIPSVPVSSGELDFSITYKRKNLVEESPMYAGKTFHAKDLDLNIYREEIFGIQKNTQYVISFEYLTNGGNFIYSFIDKKKRDEKNDGNVFFRKNLRSTSWKTEQTIVNSDFGIEKSYIEFANNYSSESSQLQIRNFSVTETTVPNVLFINDVPGEIFTPTISFQKINPVSYKISVKNASKPYFLVHADAYDKDWKLIMSPSDTFKLNPDFNYFNGQLTESTLKHDIPGIDLLFGWSDKFVAEQSHYVANGYANGWYVTPNDVNNKKDYDLILVYNGQKPFYVGLFLSALSCVIYFVLVIRLFIIHLKK